MPGFSINSLLRAFLLLHLTILLAVRTDAQSDSTKLKGKIAGTVEESIDRAKGKKKPNRLVPLPVVLYQPETSWQFGANISYFFRYRKDTLANLSYANMKGVYTLNKQFILESFIDLYTPANERAYHFEFRFRKYPEFFFGIGNDTEEESREEFSFRSVYSHFEFTRQLGNYWYLGPVLRLNYLFDAEFQEGSLLEMEDFRGKSGHFVASIGAKFSFDNREHNLYPYKGSYLSISNLFNRSFNEEPFSYFNVRIDLRNFTRLYKEHILALQFIAEFNSGDPPFKMMAELGGIYIMRGYLEGRYRDRHIFQGQMEYRFPIYWRIRGTAFASLGEVASSFSNFQWDKLQFSYGAGIRFFVDELERVTLRFDYGRTLDGNNGFYFRMNEAF